MRLEVNDTSATCVDIIGYLSAICGLLTLHETTRTFVTSTPLRFSRNLKILFSFVAPRWRRGPIGFGMENLVYRVWQGQYLSSISGARKVGPSGTYAYEFMTRYEIDESTLPDEHPEEAHTRRHRGRAV